MPPDGVLDPDQAPEAIQLVAFVEDQVRTEDPLNGTEFGLAEIFTVGGGMVTVTPAEQVADTPAEFIAVIVQV